MSAFLCSPAHLSALVNYAAAHTRAGCCFELMRAPAVRLAAINGMPLTARKATPTDADWTYTALLTENLNSLETRYPGKGCVEEWLDGDPFEYDWRPMHARSHIETIKLCHSYAYQACEHDGWETSESKRWIDDLERHAIGHLPGYDAAPWTLD